MPGFSVFSSSFGCVIPKRVVFTSRAKDLGALTATPSNILPPEKQLRSG